MFQGGWMMCCREMKGQKNPQRQGRDYKRDELFWLANEGVTRQIINGYILHNGFSKTGTIVGCLFALCRPHLWQYHEILMCCVRSSLLVLVLVLEIWWKHSKLWQLMQRFGLFLFLFTISFCTSQSKLRQHLFVFIIYHFFFPSLLIFLFFLNRSLSFNRMILLKFLSMVH